MRVFTFCTTFVWNVSHSKKNQARYGQHFMLIFMYIASYLCCHILTKLEFSRQFFENAWNIKFHENPSSGSQFVPCGRTDRRNEANISFSKFWERAYKWLI